MLVKFRGQNFFEGGSDVVSTVIPFESLSVGVLFFLFSSHDNLIAFGFHVVGLVRWRMAVRSARKFNERISKYDFSKLMG